MWLGAFETFEEHRPPRHTSFGTLSMIIKEKMFATSLKAHYGIICFRHCASKRFLICIFKTIWNLIFRLYGIDSQRFGFKLWGMSRLRFAREVDGLSTIKGCGWCHSVEFWGWSEVMQGRCALKNGIWPFNGILRLWTMTVEVWWERNMTGILFWNVNQKNLFQFEDWRHWNFVWNVNLKWIDFQWNFKVMKALEICLEFQHKNEKTSSKILSFWIWNFHWNIFTGSKSKKNAFPRAFQWKFSWNWKGNKIFTLERFNWNRIFFFLELEAY